MAAPAQHRLGHTAQPPSGAGAGAATGIGAGAGRMPPGRTGAGGRRVSVCGITGAGRRRRRVGTAGGSSPPWKLPGAGAGGRAPGRPPLVAAATGAGSGAGGLVAAGAAAARAPAAGSGAGVTSRHSDDAGPVSTTGRAATVQPAPAVSGAATGAPGGWRQIWLPLPGSARLASPVFREIPHGAPRTLLAGSIKARCWPATASPEGLSAGGATPACRSRRRPHRLLRRSAQNCCVELWRSSGTSTARGMAGAGEGQPSIGFAVWRLPLTGRLKGRRIDRGSGAVALTAFTPARHCTVAVISAARPSRCLPVSQYVAIDRQQFAAGPAVLRCVE